MTDPSVTAQLDRIADADDFLESSHQLVNEWASSGVGVEAVEPILRFIERQPHIDFGSPGPLVHFAERFYGHGYEGMLIDSVQRKPTALTAWMLNRVINGTKTPSRRGELIDEMERITTHPLADDATRQGAEHFVERSRLKP